MRRELNGRALAALCLLLGLTSGCSQKTRSLSAWLSADGGAADSGPVHAGKGDDDAKEDDDRPRPDRDDDVPPEPEPSDDTAEPEPRAEPEPTEVEPEPKAQPEPEAVEPEPEPAPEPSAVEPEPEPAIDGGDLPEPIDSGLPEPEVGVEPDVDAGPVCTPVSAVESLCDDLIDDDCDGRVDCLDPDCAPALVCCTPSDSSERLCDNTVDEDCDGLKDCADPDCATDISCLPACQPVSSSEGDCQDGADGDCDRLVDCADSDCATAAGCLPACVPVGPNEGACNDALDGDCDGFADCADSDCATDGACQTACVPATEDCTDGADNDCDGFIDCADSACAASAACCVPSGPEVCTDGLDNDCNGVIDCPVIVTTVPESPPEARADFEGGAVAANAARITLQTPAKPSYVVQCRSGKPGSVGSAPFVACNAQNPSALTVQPFPDSEAGNAALDGVMITEVRFAYPNGQVSQPASFRYYVHKSLAGAQPCPRKAPDPDFFTAARPYLTKQNGPVFADADAQLAAPFVNLAFTPRVSSLFTVTAGEGDVEYLSLRRRFTLSPEKDLVMMRRVYASRRAGNRPCLTAMIRKHDTDLGPVGTHDWNRYHRTGCDVVVMNKEGAGVCLVVDGGGTISVANPQNDRWGYWNFDVYGVVNWRRADNFMWRKLLQTGSNGTLKMFSPKCYAGGSTCTGTDPNILYLPDRSLFPLP